MRVPIPHADRHAGHVEALAKAVHEVAAILLGHLLGAAGEQHERRRTGLGLGHVLGLDALAADEVLNEADITLGVGDASALASESSNFIWSDMALIPHNDTQGSGGSHDWTNGALLKILPTDSQALTK